METSGSPTKRTRLMPSSSFVATSAADVILSEPALLETIVGFIPLEEGETSVSKAQIVLTTIAALCRAIPILGQLVGPSNERLWRSLVLSHFDFELESESYNVEDICETSANADYPQAYLFGEENGYFADDWKNWREEHPEEWQAWFTNPAREPLLAWDAAHPDRTPDSFFEEDYMRWKTLAVLFRPSQYGFLHKIQQDQKLADTDEWPEHEQAFSLFCDLVTLQKIVREDDEAYRTFSDGDAYVRPCLLSALDVELSQEGYELLKHTGLYPHYWFEEEIVRPRWSGLDDPSPPSGDLGEKVDQSAYYYPEIDEEDEMFPTCRPRDFVALRRLAYDTCDDWRKVSTVYNVGSGPIFQIGRSKTSGRWFGLTGECQA